MKQVPQFQFQSFFCDVCLSFSLWHLTTELGENSIIIISTANLHNINFYGTSGREDDAFYGVIIHTSEMNSTRFVMLWSLYCLSWAESMKRSEVSTWQEQCGDIMVVHSCHVSVNKKFNLTQICSRLRSKTLFLSLKTFWFELEFNSVSRDHWCADAARLHVAHRTIQQIWNLWSVPERADSLHLIHVEKAEKINGRMIVSAGGK